MNKTRSIKFRAGDEVLVTAGKDKGKRGKITAVNLREKTVVVAGMNLYNRHKKPYAGQAGERVRLERPLALAKIAIWNSATEKADRIGFRINADGTKTRIYRKTGQEIEVK